MPLSPSVGGLNDLTAKQFAELACFSLARASEAVFWLDSSGSILYANQSACIFLGYSSGELVGLTIHDIDPTFLREAWAEHWETTKKQGPVIYISTRQTKQGRSLPVEMTMSHVEMGGKGIICVFVRDISEQVRREKVLSEARGEYEDQALRRRPELFGVEDRYRNLFDTMAQGVVYQNPSGEIIAANPAAEVILGLSRDELIGRTHLDAQREATRADGTHLPGKEHPAMVALRTRKPVHGFIMGVHNPKLGVRRWISVDAVPRFRPGERAPFELLATFSDITQMKAALEALAASEEKSRRFSEEASFDGVMAHEGSSILDASQPMLQMLGYTIDELLGMSPVDIVVPELRAEFQKHMAEGSEAPLQFMALRKDGSTFPIESRAKNPRLRAEMVRAVVVRDISGRVGAEKVLRDAEERYRTLFERASDAIIIIAGQGPETGCILDANLAAAEMHQMTREEMAQENMAELISPKDADKAQRIILRALEGDCIKGEVSHRKKDGSEFPVEVSAGAVEFGGRRYILLHNRDISQRRQLDKHLRHLQQMEAMAKFAGSVAHDFNNLLQAAVGYLELLGMVDDLADEAKKYISELNRATGRARDMVDRLVIFSRKDELELVPQDMNQQILKVVGRLEGSLPKNAKIETLLAPDLASVLADSYQLEQVFVNLCRNSQNAMPEGGTITITTASIELDEQSAAGLFGMEPGPHVELTVRDTGTGMSPDTLKKIFYPFFTTKKARKGNGLGLSIVYSILQGHKAYISCQSELGQGTAFRILFPAMAGEDRGV